MGGGRRACRQLVSVLARLRLEPLGLLLPRPLGRAKVLRQPLQPRSLRLRLARLLLCVQQLAPGLREVVAVTFRWRRGREDLKR